jgi:hypothetical protein
MKRTTITFPGYDHIANPCGKNGCGTNPGSGHGVASDEWFYVVSDGNAALVLSVFSKVYPPTVSAAVRSFRDSPSVSNFAFHTAYPVEQDDVRAGGEGRKCQFVEGGRCWASHLGYGAGTELLKTYGHPTYEQPEALWLELEKRFLEERARAETERTTRCPHCNGAGTVPDLTMPTPKPDAVPR